MQRTWAILRSCSVNIFFFIMINFLMVETTFKMPETTQEMSKFSCNILVDQAKAHKE